MGHALPVEDQPENSKQTTTVTDVPDVVEVTEGEGDGTATTGGSVEKISDREKPAQKKLQDGTGNLKTQFHSLVTLQQTGLSSVDKKQIDSVKASIKEKELILKN